MWVMFQLGNIIRHEDHQKHYSFLWKHAIMTAGGVSSPIKLQLQHDIPLLQLRTYVQTPVDNGAYW